MLKANGFVANGLKANGFVANGLKANGLKADGLKAYGLKANGWKATGLKANGLKAYGLRANGLKVNCLNTHGLKTNGLRANDSLFQMDLQLLPDLPVCPGSDGHHLGKLFSNIRRFLVSTSITYLLFTVIPEICHAALWTLIS